MKSHTRPPTAIITIQEDSTLPHSRHSWPQKTTQERSILSVRHHQGHSCHTIVAVTGRSVVSLGWNPSLSTQLPDNTSCQGKVRCQLRLEPFFIRCHRHNNIQNVHRVGPTRGVGNMTSSGNSEISLWTEKLVTTFWIRDSRLIVMIITEGNKSGSNQDKNNMPPCCVIKVSINI